VTAKILPARIDVEGALKRFRRRRWGNLFGLWQAPPAKVDEQGQPASLELVWMPVYAYQFNLIYRGKQATSWVSVDASFGGFALLGRVNDIVDETPEGEVFPPVLGREAGENLAREGVIRYILRKRGAKPSVDDITDRMTFHTPVWVYYFRTIGGKMDLAVLDAYSGDTMGGLVRRSVVDAFIARSREKAGA
jgi:hypothetical protein